ncbi:hypothetical protein BH10PSE2_BH10PSE2_02080 [soil metagenome]
MENRARKSFALIATVALTSGLAATHAVADEVECYDAEVSARIVSQTPTVFPDYGDGSIVISWPWIVDLDINRVRSGNIRHGHLTVLAVMHNNYRRDLGSRRWKLRRNDLGGFNLLRSAENLTTRCGADQPPAKAFITPPDGQTVEDLRREGREVIDRYTRDN